ncbi:hypothetical protein AAC387_Pa05g1517 [Persea americana]
MESRSCFREALPYVAMILMEFLDVGVTTLLKAAMTKGASQLVMIVYSNAIGALILLPTSYVLERRRGLLTFRLLCWFFFLGFIGITVMQYFALTGISYSSPALASTLSNLVPVYTFILAVIFGFEKLNIRSLSTQARVLGTLVCISGALTASLYKGPSLWTPSSSIPLHLSSHHPAAGSVKRKNWVLGGVFLFTAGICVSFWNILQAATLKKYPWEITIVAFNVLSSAFQSAIVTLILERRNPSAWRISSNIELIATVYLAIVGNVITFTIQTWCIRRRGPIFMVMFKPLGIVIATISSTFILGDTLFLGSVIGGIIIVAGFYSVMWGQAKEQKKIEAKQDDGLGFGSSSQILAQEEKSREDIQDEELSSSSHRRAKQEKREEIQDGEVSSS